MKKVIATIGLTGALLILSCEPLLASTQQNRNASNRNTSIKNEMKQSGKQVTEAGKSLGHNVKHGRVARGGKHFGKHIYSAGKHFGKGSGMAAKKTGRAVKNAAKP